MKRDQRRNCAERVLRSKRRRTHTLTVVALTECRARSHDVRRSDGEMSIARRGHIGLRTGTDGSCILRRELIKRFRQDKLRQRADEESRFSTPQQTEGFPFAAAATGDAQPVVFTRGDRFRSICGTGLGEVRRRCFFRFRALRTASGNGRNGFRFQLTATPTRAFAGGRALAN